MSKRSKWDCPEWGARGHLYRPYSGPGEPLRCKCGEPEPEGEQGSLDLEAGRRARDEGMARVDEGVSEEWKAIADDAVDQVARLHYEFIVDEVWEVLDHWGVERPRDSRAIGPRMTAAKDRGIIEPTDRFRSSKQPTSHATPRRIWRSRIRREEQQ